MKKKILGTSDAWSTSRLSHRLSEPAYYIVDCRIFSVLHQINLLVIISKKISLFFLKRIEENNMWQKTSTDRWKCHLHRALDCALLGLLWVQEFGPLLVFLKWRVNEEESHFCVLTSSKQCDNAALVFEKTSFIYFPPRH